jgi:hypothetical protein
MTYALVTFYGDINFADFAKQSEVFPHTQFLLQAIMLRFQDP